MNKFILFFDDNRFPVELNTEHQVQTYLQNSVPDVSRVSIYQYVGDAVRNGWTLPTTKTSSEKNASPSRKNLRWTEQETLKALKMRKRGVPGEVIARELGRTKSAVYSRLHSYAP
jgi:hypothetical protein